MRTIIYIILTIAMINIVLSDTGCEKITPSKKKDCTDYKLTDEEKKEEDADSCCYITDKDNEKDCGSFKKKEVNKDYVKELEAYWKVTDFQTIFLKIHDIIFH